jgi:hypothetical protein
MAAPAAIAEEAPEFGAIFVALELTLGFCFLWALRQAWIHTLGAVLIELGHVLNFDRAFIHIHWGNFFLRLDARIQQTIVDHLIATQYAMGEMWHEVGRLQHWLSHEIWALGRDTFHFGAWAIGTYVPTYVKAITDPLGLAARALTRAAHAAEGRIAHLTRTTSIPYAHQWRWIHRHWKPFALAVALAPTIPLHLPHTIGRLWHTIYELRHWRAHTNKRLRRLEAAITATGAAAILANVTGTRIPCWRGRGNIARLLRHVCGSPAWLLDLLILGAVEAFVATDLCVFTDLLIKEATFVRPALIKLVDVEDALIGCHGTTKPLALDLPPLSLPSVVGTSPLAA